jgi:hypothetical protein
MSSSSVSTTSDTPKILVSIEKDGYIHVLDDDLLDLIGGAVGLPADPSFLDWNCTTTNTNCPCPNPNPTPSPTPTPKPKA